MERGVLLVRRAARQPAIATFSGEIVKSGAHLQPASTAEAITTLMGAPGPLIIVGQDALKAAWTSDLAAY